MLSRWRNDGVDLGLPTLLAAATVFVDSADEEAVELGLTMRLMIRYKRPIPPGLAEAQLSAFTELQGKYAPLPEMTLDNALTRKYLPRKRPAASAS
jgi:hypothetical protein